MLAVRLVVGVGFSLDLVFLVQPTLGFTRPLEA